MACYMGVFVPIVMDDCFNGLLYGCSHRDGWLFQWLAIRLSPSWWMTVSMACYMGVFGPIVMGDCFNGLLYGCVCPHRDGWLFQWLAIWVCLSPSWWVTVSMACYMGVFGPIVMGDCFNGLLYGCVCPHRDGWLFQWLAIWVCLAPSWWMTVSMACYMSVFVPIVMDDCFNGLLYGCVCPHRDGWLFQWLAIWVCLSPSWWMTVSMACYMFVSIVMDDCFNGLL